MFYRNGYPMSFFDKAFKKFLDKHNASLTPTVEEIVEDVQTVSLSIPYIGEASNQFAKQMVSLFRTTFNIKLLPVFTSSKIGDYFSLKSDTPFPYSTNVVYQFHCLRDAGCSYVGHLSLDKPRSHKSEIKSHIYKCPSCHKQFLSIDNFKVLKKCKSSYETRIHEALRIKKLRPKLNKQLMKGGCHTY